MYVNFLRNFYALFNKNKFYCISTANLKKYYMNGICTWEKYRNKKYINIIFPSRKFVVKLVCIEIIV